MKDDTKGKLFIVRHAQSEWNKLNKWTGKTDVHLSEEGKEQAKKLGELLKDYRIDEAVTSAQIRTQETLDCIEERLGKKFPKTCSDCINERDYGDYTGMNKLEVQKECGDQMYHDIRRGWVCPIPNGETLKDVYDRALPYYKEYILPRLQEGRNILMVAHGNSIRAMMKYIENISDEGISHIEMPFKQILVYEVGTDGRMTGKRILELKD